MSFLNNYLITTKNRILFYSVIESSQNLSDAFFENQFTIMNILSSVILLLNICFKISLNSCFHTYSLKVNHPISIRVKYILF